MKDAYLLLGDGQIFKGKRIGSERDAVGELVFTTAVVGCNKTLSDPNYYGQLLLFTFPAVGNCGLITADFESGGVHAFGVVVRELCGAPSNFRSEGTLGDYLQKADVPGICGVDTRRLTAILRDKGTMNACICADPTAVDMDALNGYAVGDAVARVSVKEKTHYETPDARCRVSLLDYGTSAELLAELQSRGCAVTVYPQDTPAEAILADRPDGVLLGDGPGDPKISPQRIETVRALCGKTPLFAVGLGHELLALAAGGDTFKLPYGHRGASLPVTEQASGRTVVTSQNHGYAVAADSIPAQVGKISFLNANDGTAEGVTYTKFDAFSVQFRPAESAGPLNTAQLYDAFVDKLAGAR